MGIFWNRQSATKADESSAETKELGYGQYQPASQYSGAFSLPALNYEWTDPADYAKRAKAILHNSTAKACVLKRAQAIANIDIKYDGKNNKVIELLKRPNYRDGTIQVLLNNGETNLSIGGDLYAFWDKTLASRPALHTLRPDLVVNDTKRGAYFYKPSPSDEADLVFEYDNLGRTVRALKRNGRGYSVFQGGLQQISYFDPLSSTNGAGAGDSALRAIDTMNAIDKMLVAKFRSGGAKAGYFQVKGNPTEREIEKLHAEMAMLNPDGSAHILPAGVDFNGAQLTLAEMEILAARVAMAQDICTAFQVPYELLNSSETTYANARGMDKIFYRNFIGPEGHWIIGQLEVGLQLYIDPNAAISLDETSVQHLEEDRTERAAKMAQMKCFTADEIRAVQGYEPAPEGAEFLGADVNMGQPEEKPKGPVAFNADAGNRGDNNE